MCACVLCCLGLSCNQLTSSTKQLVLTEASLEVQYVWVWVSACMCHACATNLGLVVHHWGLVQADGCNSGPGCVVKTGVGRPCKPIARATHV